MAGHQEGPEPKLVRYVTEAIGEAADLPDQAREGLEDRVRRGVGKRLTGDLWGYHRAKHSQWRAVWEERGEARVILWIGLRADDYATAAARIRDRG